MRKYPPWQVISLVVIARAYLELGSSQSWATKLISVLSSCGEKGFFVVRVVGEGRRFAVMCFIYGRKMSKRENPFETGNIRLLPTLLLPSWHYQCSINKSRRKSTVIAFTTLCMLMSRVYWCLSYDRLCFSNNQCILNVAETHRNKRAKSCHGSVHSSATLLYK